MKATVSERGQVTIPKRLRERLGIRPGSILDMEEEKEGRLVAIKADSTDPITAVTGILDATMTTDQFIEAVRGEILPAR